MTDSQRGKRCLRRKTCSSAASFTTNPTRTGLLLNTEFCNEKSATNLLNHDTLLCLEQCIFLEIFFTSLSVLRSSPLPRTLMCSSTLTQFLKHLTFQHKVLSTSRLSFFQIIFMYKPKCHYARHFRFCVNRCVINVKFSSLYNPP